jgi:hypothetical protein
MKTNQETECHGDLGRGGGRWEEVFDKSRDDDQEEEAEEMADVRPE